VETSAPFVYWKTRRATQNLVYLRLVFIRPNFKT
jgi:hypothetical protein